MTTIINGSSPSITFSDGSAQTSATRPFQNRIINGAMVIDQRNAGATVTIPDATGTYTLDRWRIYEETDGVITVNQDSTAPAGFTKSLKVAVTTADGSLSAAQTSFIQQSIEGFNIADFAWGSASAVSITVSFWVRSSVTGTFGGSARNDSTRSYPFSYTISAANTWEQKSITIAGDTTGTWATTNGTGLRLYFSLGDGGNLSGTAGAWTNTAATTTTGATNLLATSGATFFITGVQLEVGSTATSFDYRPYGTELALCQRYYYRTALLATGVIAVSAFADSTTTFGAYGNFPVRLRTNPSALEQSGTASHYSWNGVSGITCSAVPTFSGRTTADIWQVNGTVSSGLTAGQGGSFVTAGGAGYLGWSAEL